MKYMDFVKGNISMSFVIDEEGRLLISHIGTKKSEKKEKVRRFFVPIEVFATGENPDDHHGAKHTGSKLSDSLRYVSHTDDNNSIVFTLQNEKIRVLLYYEKADKADVIQSYAHVKNISNEDMCLEYVSSFCAYDFDFDKICLCHNAWCREIEWRCYAPKDLGYSRITEFSSKRISVSNTGTWSSKEYLPMGMISDNDETMFWQIEHNGSWNFEISDIQNANYIKLSGPSEQENGWWKFLKPAESYKTVKAAVAFGVDFDGALKEMTSYRKEIAYQSDKDKNLPVIFNDYMLCLNADPTTDKEIPVIDAAAEVGAEIFCMDAGWYADGTWWETVGEWKVCESRFPGGIKKVFEYIRSKNMRPGIWLEPESIGISCPILDMFDDDCFFMRHGKRVVDHGRYQLDFRSEKVTSYLDKIVDRLIDDLQIEYFKFDYNIEGGVGTEVNSDSFGDGLMKHQEAYLNWIDGIYKRHPGIIIENCASGGMRMDYKTLTKFSVSSLTDATEYKSTATIAAMAPTAVLPRQAQVWVIPMKDNTDGEIALNMVSAMFKRPVISGETHLLDESKKDIIKSGIKFYKEIRDEIPNLVPYYPIGAVNFEDDIIVSAYAAKEHTYMCIQRLGGDRDEIAVPTGSYTNCKCVFADKETKNYVDKFMNIDDKRLRISLPPYSGAVIKIS